jgi:hypothetical protein
MAMPKGSFSNFQVSEKSGKIRRKNGPDILLGSGSVDPTVLSRVIQVLILEKLSPSPSTNKLKYLSLATSFSLVLGRAANIRLC